MTGMRKAVLGRRWACLGLGAAVSGCGFQPVYMPTASGKPGVAQRELAKVFVPVIAERPGQLLRQALQERLRDDSGTPSAYELAVAFTISGDGIALVVGSGLSTYTRLTGVAYWTLTAKNDPARAKLAAGSARTFDGANSINSEFFASGLEVEAVQKRIAEDIAQQITVQLAAWFHKQAFARTG